VHLSSLKGHTQQISNVKFSSESSDLLYTSSLDGKLKVSIDTYLYLSPSQSLDDSGFELL